MESERGMDETEEAAMGTTTGTNGSVVGRGPGCSSGEKTSLTRLGLMPYWSAAVPCDEELDCSLDGSLVDTLSWT